MARLRTASALCPGPRLLCLALISSALFFLAPAWVGVLGLGFLLFCLGEGVPPRMLLRESTYILWLGAMAVALECVSFSGGPFFDLANLAPAGIYTLRLGAAFFAGRLFYAATPGPELRRAALAVGRVLPRRLRSRAALATFLVLGIIPLVLSDWRASLEAARSRGYGRGKRPGASVDLLAAFLRRLMLDAIGLPEVLASRGWYGEARHSPSKEDWGVLDLGAAAASLGILVAAILGSP